MKYKTKSLRAGGLIVLSGRPRRRNFTASSISTAPVLCQVGGTIEVDRGKETRHYWCIIGRCIPRPASPWKRSLHAGQVVLPRSAPGKTPLALRSRESPVSYHC